VAPALRLADCERDPQGVGDEACPARSSGSSDARKSSMTSLLLVKQNRNQTVAQNRAPIASRRAAQVERFVDVMFSLPTTFLRLPQGGFHPVRGNNMRNSYARPGSEPKQPSLAVEFVATLELPLIPSQVRDISLRMTPIFRRLPMDRHLFSPRSHGESPTIYNRISYKSLRFEYRARSLPRPPV
jgi:hypothetical protein